MVAWRGLLLIDLDRNDEGIAELKRSLDMRPNTLAAGTTYAFTAHVITYADVILADQPIGFYRFEETTGQTTKNYGTAGASADGRYMTGAGEAEEWPSAGAPSATSHRSLGARSLIAGQFWLALLMLPGMSSSRLMLRAFCLRPRWPVIANRCASSRT